MSITEIEYFSGSSTIECLKVWMNEWTTMYWEFTDEVAYLGLLVDVELFPIFENSKYLLQLIFLLFSFKFHSHFPFHLMTMWLIQNQFAIYSKLGLTFPWCWSNITFNYSWPIVLSYSTLIEVNVQQWNVHVASLRSKTPNPLIFFSRLHIFFAKILAWPSL